MDTGDVADLSHRRGSQNAIVSFPLYDHPVAATARCLAAVGALDARIRAMTHLDREGALQAAAASERRRAAGAALSTIDGLPIAIKANIAVACWPWTAGLAAHAERLAERDADCVARLRAAGAILIGATNMDEGALGAITDNPHFGRTHHPLRHGFTAGGSSGGSAVAVAAGYCAAALGTDTIGSIRIPASYCGVVGHKPRRGDIDVDGIVPLSPTLDTVGVLARDVATAREVTAIAAGRSIAAAPVLAGMRIGVADWTASIDLPPIGEAIARAADMITAIGGRPVPIKAAALPLARLQKLLLVIAEVEGARVHRQALSEHPQRFSPALSALLIWGAGPGAARYEATRRELEAIGAATRGALAGIDALLLPATPQTAFAFNSPLPPNQALFATLAALLGDPATVFPIGRTADGMPIGAQIVAMDEDRCLGLAEALMAQWASSPPETFIDSAVI